MKSLEIILQFLIIQMFEILVEVNEIIFAVKKIYHIFDEQHMKKKNEKISITDYQPSNCA